MPELFEQLKQKYQQVLDTIQKEGAELQNLNIDGNQLYLKAIAVSEASQEPDLGCDQSCRPKLC